MWTMHNNRLSTLHTEYTVSFFTHRIVRINRSIALFFIHSLFYFSNEISKLILFFRDTIAVPHMV